MKLFVLSLCLLSSFSAMALTGSCAGKIEGTAASVCVQIDSANQAHVDSLKQNCDGAWSDLACPVGANGACTALDANEGVQIFFGLYNATEEMLANGKVSCENNGGTWH
jgi:hypothetical protein